MPLTSNLFWSLNPLPIADSWHNSTGWSPALIFGPCSGHDPCRSLKGPSAITLPNVNWQPWLHFIAHAVEPTYNHAYILSVVLHPDNAHVWVAVGCYVPTYVNNPEIPCLITPACVTWLQPHYMVSMERREGTRGMGHPPRHPPPPRRKTLRYTIFIQYLLLSPSPLICFGC